MNIESRLRRAEQEARREAKGFVRYSIIVPDPGDPNPPPIPPGAIRITFPCHDHEPENPR